MSKNNTNKTSPAHVPGAPYPIPFDTPEAGNIVMLNGREGLHQAVKERSDGRWTFRALNIDGKPLVTASAAEMITFDLPIYFCFASRHPGEIVALVSGPDFDVTYNPPEVAAPLFQKVYSGALIQFAELAKAAGFDTVELTNGYVPREGTIEELIEECRELAAGNSA